MRATTKDLRLHSKDLLDAVERGEEVTITYRGKPMAVLTQIRNETAPPSVGDSELFGIWGDRADGTSDPAKFVRSLRTGRSFPDNDEG